MVYSNIENGVRIEWVRDEQEGQIGTRSHGALNAKPKFRSRAEHTKDLSDLKKGEAGRTPAFSKVLERLVESGLEGAERSERESSEEMIALETQ